MHKHKGILLWLRKKITRLIIGLFVVLLVIWAISYTLSETNGESVFDQKIIELQDLGYTVEGYPGTLEDAKNDRLATTFRALESWESFKQKVEDTKITLCTVTIRCNENEGILWVYTGREYEHLNYFRASAYYYKVND